MKKLTAQLKKEAVFKVVFKKENITNIFREYGIARKTLYGWINRYKESHNNSIETFQPRYVSGKDHPRARYPRIEKQVLTLVSKSPEMSIEALSHHVPVSVWGVNGWVEIKDIQKT